MFKSKTIKNKYYVMILIVLVLSIILANSIFAQTEVGTSRTIGNSENEEEVLFLITKYYTEKNENLMNGTKYEMSDYFLENSKIKEYIKLKNEYYVRNRELSSVNLLWGNTEIELNNIKATDTVAEVSINEIFLHQYEGQDLNSSVGIIHSINLQKISGEWKITAIYSNDEFDRVYKKMEISEVEKIINEEPTVVSDEYKAYMAKNEEEMVALWKQVSSIKSWTSTSYNRTEASDYALEYSSNTPGSSSYNSLFVNCANWGGDCQNFGSQTVFAGFGGDYDSSTAINNKDLPMIDSGTRVWWATSSSVDGGENGPYHWSNCDHFGDYVEDGGYLIEGIYGWIYTGSVNFAYPGDIIQVRNTSSSTDWVHSYVVTSVTGTQGSLDPDDIYICSHTADLNNILLDDRVSNEALLRVIRIGWHYSEDK